MWKPCITLIERRLVCGYRVRRMLSSEQIADHTQYFDVFNPANGRLVGSVADLTPEDAESTVQRASLAFQTWRNTTAKERSDILKTWHSLIRKNSRRLTELIVTEMGKPLKDAEAELEYGSGFVEWFAEEAKRTYGDVIPSSSASKRVIVVKEPVGVAALITPWNFPLAMITRKAAPALAAGCTVVLKAAEDTPFTALALEQLATDAGVPEGVFNVLTCSREQTPAVGKVLCEHPLVSHLSFTGSTATGKTLLAQCSSTIKKVSLELGGNSPFIVFSSANIDQAVQSAIVSKFRCSGQTCVCVNRFLVEDSVYQEFITKLRYAMQSQLVVGDGMSYRTTQGPLINIDAIQKVDTLIEDAVRRGAEVVLGGRRHEHGQLFYEPTLLTHVTSDMDVTNNEIFGPIAAVQRFSSEEEAIDIANNTTYGLASYIFSQDVTQCWRVSGRLQCGMVGINEGLLPAVEVPMGGIKQSGLGREGSKYGIDEFLEIKYKCFGNIL